jgi:hypothetical protein
LDVRWANAQTKSITNMLVTRRIFGIFMLFSRLARLSLLASAIRGFHCSTELTGIGREERHRKEEFPEQENGLWLPSRED